MAILSNLTTFIPTAPIADGRHRAVVSYGSTSALLKQRSPLQRRFLGNNFYLKPTTASLTARCAPPSALRARAETDEYEVELDRPYGIKFYKGEDGGTYVDALAAGQAADKTGVIQEGDKVIATSAVFGDDMWPASGYGQTMYTVRNRIGYMRIKFQRMFGDKIPEAQKEQYLEDRGNGQVTDAVREKQIENYSRKLELEEQRVEMLEAGLSLYRQGKYQEGKQRFQSIIGMEPEYKEAGIAFYNVACCCSKLNQLDEGLDTLESAFESGFEDYKKVRSDPDLSQLRGLDEFDDLMDKFDEPFINENAIKALTSVFGMFGPK